MLEQAIDLMLLQVTNLQLNHLVELSHINRPIPVVVACCKHLLRLQGASAILNYAS